MGARLGGQIKVDNKLKVLMQELGNAINESLSDSDRIAAAIGEIRRAGYDVFLVLEATIGFHERDNTIDDETGCTKAEMSDPPPAGFISYGPPNPMDMPNPKDANKRKYESSTKLKWTSQDQKFLRALKIAIDEENR